MQNIDTFWNLFAQLWLKTISYPYSHYASRFLSYTIQGNHFNPLTPGGSPLTSKRPNLAGLGIKGFNHTAFRQNNTIDIFLPMGISIAF